MSSQEAKALSALIRQSSGWNKALNEVREDLKNTPGDFRYLEEVKIEIASANGVRVEWIIPPEVPEDKLIVYFHGGGYCLGIVDTNRNFAARIAKDSGFKVLLIDYRLAPENPYPAAIEDAVSVYEWILHGGYLPQNIVFAGDSSGCGLAMVALGAARERRWLMPVAMVFMSPAIDFSYGGESLKTRAELDPFQLKPEAYIANNYVLNNDSKSPEISPIYTDIKGLPPMLIHAADHDIFLSDALELSKKAECSGVDVNIKVWDEMWHIFHMYADYVPEGREALDEIYTYISKWLL